MYHDITAARAEVRLLLPQFLHRVVQSYQDYLTMPGAPTADDPKQYGTYHTGAKTALTHIELLLRMHKSFDAGEDVTEDHTAELAAAQAELDGYASVEAGDA